MRDIRGKTPMEIYFNINCYVTCLLVELLQIMEYMDQEGNN